MGRKEYLESMGVRAARRFLFLYDRAGGELQHPPRIYPIPRSEPYGYGQAEKPKAAAFLTDYILLRIYVAKYVLAGYAETYAPLLDLFRGFEKWKRNSPCLWNGKQRPAMARNESFCRLICRDAMMSAACGRLSNF